jgi:hypothetical protein
VALGGVDMLGRHALATLLTPSRDDTVAERFPQPLLADRKPAGVQQAGH